ncbi:MAG: molybdate ABC transporter permease subunit, partial [Alphaproteobacteria bacterium]|nr:molybdate ABC transporter permease subunit [Alphaproteobacteria bacterium]
IAGTILAFARSLGEFGATITFVSNIPGETQTLPLALYNFTQLPGDQTPAIRLLLISLVLAFSALIASDVLARRVNKRLGVNNGGAR